jgi:phosphatidylglycerophosphate synthase
VTIVNTLLGFLSGYLFTMGYSARVAGAVLFLLVVTLDGVDGEVARLKMQETDFGATLDLVTDAIVNMVVVLGVILGCYRAGGNRAYLYLLPLFAGGFALCAIASYSGGEILARQFAQTGLVGRAFDLAGLCLLAVVFCPVRPARNRRMGSRLP